MERAGMAGGGQLSSASSPGAIHPEFHGLGRLKHIQGLASLHRAGEEATRLEKEEEWKVCCLCEAISSLRQSSLPVKHPNTHQNKPHLVLPAPSTHGAGPGATSRQKTRLEFPGEQLGFGRIGCPAPASWPAKPKQVLDLGGKVGVCVSV